MHFYPIKIYSIKFQDQYKFSLDYNICGIMFIYHQKQNGFSNIILFRAIK